MGEIIPSNFSLLEQKITELSKALVPPVTSWTSFREVALSCNIQEASVDTAIRYFSETGSIIHFADQDLSDLVILDPQWLTDCIHFTLKLTKATKGKLFLCCC